MGSSSPNQKSSIHDITGDQHHTMPSLEHAFSAYGHQH